MGWDEADLLMHQNGRTVNKGSQKESMTSISMENSLYPSYQSRASNYSQDSCSFRDSDDDVMDPRISSQPNLTSAHSRSVDTLFLDTDSLFQRVHDSLQDAKVDLTKSQETKDFVMIDYPSSPSHEASSQDRMSKMSQDMDEASRLCDEMLSGFRGVPDTKRLDEEEECYTPDIDKANMRKYHKTRRSTETPSPSIIASNRLSVTSNNLSFSEPDLVVLSLKSNPAVMDSKERSDETDDFLMTSLPDTILRKFTEPDHPRLQSKAEKQKGKFRLKSKKSKPDDDREKKLEPAAVSDRRHTLNPSSSLYFNSSHEIKEPRQSPSRGFTSIFKKKDKEAKKVKKTPSMHAGDYPDGVTPETPSRRRTTRSSSLAPSLDRHVYINIDEFGGNSIIFAFLIVLE